MHPIRYYVSSCRNKGDSEMSGVENRGQISHFLTHVNVKIKRRVGENAEWNDRVSRPTFNGRPLYTATWV